MNNFENKLLKWTQMLSMNFLITLKDKKISAHKFGPGVS